MTATSPNNKSLCEIAADKLIAHIVDDGLEEGDRLPNEKDLCDLLQVGRSTLREAVRMLSSRNILTVRYGSGIYVSDQLGLSDDPLGFIFLKDKLKLVHDLVDFRLMFEPRIASMTAMVAAPKDVEQLQRAELKVEKRIKLKENHSREDLNFTALLPRSQAISSSLNLSPFFLRQ